MKKQDAPRPLVSVCIPTRNRSLWLDEALDSVARQTLRDHEVVVCDDASDDGSAETLTERVAARNDPRVRVFRMARRQGVAACRNTCLGLARGAYVAWLDSDDRYLPRMLERQVGALEAHRDAVFAHGAFDVVDRRGDPLPAWPRPFDRDTLVSGGSAFRELITRNEIGAPTVVARRLAHANVGPYRTDLVSGEDWDMWLRLASTGDVAYTAETVAHYRWHEDSLTRRAESAGAQMGRDLRVVRGALHACSRRLGDVEALRERAGAALAARALERITDALTAGCRIRALATLSVALRARPRLAVEETTWRGALALARGDEYAWHRASHALGAALAHELGDGRLAEHLRSRRPDPSWERTLASIARSVREVVPANDAVAAIDKWDPTLLHLAGRRGWHYPDRALLRGGYPVDSRRAVEHLEALRRRGARYLVLPSSAFWWLEHYPGLRDHLRKGSSRVWSDGNCRIYRLGRRSADTGRAA